MLTPYYKSDDIILYNGDALDVLPQIERGSIDLVLTDPPYNIKKCNEWDKWESSEEYVAWSGEWIALCSELLKNNGSFYFSHNDMPQIAMLMEWIRKNTNFIFRSMIVWHKPNHMGKAWQSANGTLRSWFNICEYLLYYTFQDRRGITSIMSNATCFLPIKEYMRNEKQRVMNDKGFKTLNDFNEWINDVTGTTSIAARHYFSDSQYRFPSRVNYEKMQATGYWEKPYDVLRNEYKLLYNQYLGLKNEYESLRYTFNRQGKDNNVLSYDAGNTGKLHPTQKPVRLMRDVLVRSSNRGHIVLDPFCGSGTTLVTCRMLGRKAIGIEREEKYCETTVKRLITTQTELMED